MYLACFSHQIPDQFHDFINVIHKYKAFSCNYCLSLTSDSRSLINLISEKNNDLSYILFTLLEFKIDKFNSIISTEQKSLIENNPKDFILIIDGYKLFYLGEFDKKPVFSWQNIKNSDEICEKEKIYSFLNDFLEFCSKGIQSKIALNSYLLTRFAENPEIKEIINKNNNNEVIFESINNEKLEIEFTGKNLGKLPKFNKETGLFTDNLGYEYI